MGVKGTASGVKKIFQSVAQAFQPVPSGNTKFSGFMGGPRAHGQLFRVINRSTGRQVAWKRFF
jgi:hypothetical protein